ncbi:hypothetical protein [Burkholderia stagnalis]|uniref:hypothetical protein n=1 Tax=Burkholderia stagnalis TaxID=1503054 RepID=UPI000B2A0AF7|nr:hypothetical protein [Burkholderia stagnalis]
MKFAVTLEEMVRHTTVVEASTKEEAEGIAQARLLNGQMESFQTEVIDREFVGTEPTA